MKRIVFILVSLVSLLFADLSVASASEEIRVIASVKKAFETKQIQPIMDLYYWEGVSKKSRAKVAENILLELSSKPAIRSIQFIEPKPNELTEFVHAGVTYRANLPIIKRLEIIFEPRGAERLSTQFSVGEKNGKLYFAQLAPVK